MKRLESYHSIGWDFDGTLFDHKNTNMFADFIRTNPYNQTFHIVTFRSHGHQHDIDDELADMGLDRSYFASVNNVSDAMYEKAYLAYRSGRNPEHVKAYEDWKAITCLLIGADVLIDDMTDAVKAGCDEYGVAYVHPDTLTE